MSTTYTRRPEAVQAVQYTGDNADQVIADLDGMAFIRPSDGLLVAVVMGTIRPLSAGEYILIGGSAVYDAATFEALFVADPADVEARLTALERTVTAK